MAEERVVCRTPTPGKTGTTAIPKWKYDLLARHILDILREAGPNGVAFKDLKGLLHPRLTEDERAKLGSLGWHATSVKLELETAGALVRLPKVTPQQMVHSEFA